MIVAAAGHIADLAASDHLREVLMAREQNLDILMQTTASVMTGIDDNAFLQVVLAQDVGIDIAEAGIVHTFDMHIAQTAVRQAFHLSSTALGPTLV